MPKLQIALSNLSKVKFRVSFCWSYTLSDWHAIVLNLKLKDRTITFQLCSHYRSSFMTFGTNLNIWTCFKLHGNQNLCLHHVRLQNFMSIRFKEWTTSDLHQRTYVTVLVLNRFAEHFSVTEFFYSTMTVNRGLIVRDFVFYPSLCNIVLYLLEIAIRHSTSVPAEYSSFNS